MELGQERVAKKASKKRRVSGDRVAGDSAAEEEHGDTVTLVLAWIPRVLVPSDRVQP